MLALIPDFVRHELQCYVSVTLDWGLGLSEDLRKSINQLDK